MKHGFTLLELLIVVVIIGILAALALPRFGNVQERAYRSTMQSDLRNFASAQVIFSTAETATATSTIPDGSLQTYASTNVTLAYAAGARTAVSYTLNASHSKSTSTCSLVVSPSAANRITCDDSGTSGGTPLAATPNYTYNNGVTTYTLSGAELTLPKRWAVPVEHNGRYGRMTVIAPNATLDAGLAGQVIAGVMQNGSATMGGMVAGTYTVQVTIHPTLTDAINNTNIVATATSGPLTIN